MSEQPSAAALTGKARTCLNSLTHGGASEKLFIPGENPDDFFALLEEGFQTYQPATTEDAGLVADSALARWYLWRRQRAYSTHESGLHTAKPDVSQWTAADLHQLELFDRYKTQAERALRRALTNVQAIRKEQLREAHWQQLHALQKERFELAKSKETRTSILNEADVQHQQEVLADREFARRRKVLHSPVKVDERGGAYITQDFYIGVKKGKTYGVTAEGGNDNHRVNSMLSERHHREPQFILRTLHFDEGIPPEFQWLIGPGEAPKTKYSLSIPIGVWRKLSNAEYYSKHPLNPAIVTAEAA